MIKKNLANTGINKYMQIMSDDDMINMLLSPKDSTKPQDSAKIDETIYNDLLENYEEIKESHKNVLDSSNLTNIDLAVKNLDATNKNKIAEIYRKMLTTTFQSLTINTTYTHKILNYLYTETKRQLGLDNVVGDHNFLTEFIVLAIANSVKIIHTNYNIGTDDNDVKRLLSESGFTIPREKKVKSGQTQIWQQSSRHGLVSYKWQNDAYNQIRKKVRRKYYQNDELYAVEDDLFPVASGQKKKKQKRKLNIPGHNIEIEEYPIPGGKDRESCFEINRIIHYKMSSSEDDADRKGQKKVNLDKTLNFVNSNGNIEILNNDDDTNASSFSYILLNNPKIRAGTKNSLETSVFLNSLSTIELSKCLPFLEVKFLLPSEVSTVSGKIYQTSNITSFLNGTQRSSNITTNNYDSLTASFERKLATSTDTSFTQKAVATNMSVFTMPQTANNFNETFTGHYESYHNGYKKKNDLFSRNNIVQDITKPFLTVKSFNIDVAPTKGLMSFKSGRLSLTLHDKSRMADIAPFIKPDLFGSFGAQIAVKYGWTHIDALNKDSKTLSNPFADFLQENRVYEKYIITNSTYSMDANGQVNIDLSIAMKGPVSIRAVNFELDKPNDIENKQLVNLSNSIENISNELTQTAGIVSTGFKQLARNVLSEFSQNTNVNSTTKVEIISSALKALKSKNPSLKNLKNKTDDFKILLESVEALRNADFGVDIRYAYLNEESKQAFTNEYNADYVQQHIADRTNSVEKGGETKVIHNDKIKTALKLYNKIKALIKGASDSISTGRSKQKKSIEGLLDQIMNGLSLEDPFFDNLNYTFNDLLNNTEASKDDIADIENLISKDNKYFYNSIRGTAMQSGAQKTSLTKYVSLGNILMAVVGTHLSFTSGFDEVQVISHTLNNHAGLAKNCNVSSLLVDKRELQTFLKDLFKNGGQYTLESLMTQIIKKFFVTRYCINYGLKNLYKLDKNKNVVPKGDDKPDEFNKKINDKIAEIYEFFDKYENESKSNIINNVKFVMPKIKLIFDTVTNDESNGEATILRISVIDQHDNPFESLTSFMNRLFEEDVESVVRDINKRLIDLKSLKKGKNRIEAEKRRYLQENRRLINKLVQKGYLVENNGEFVLNTGTENAFTGIKERIKAVMPSITYGTHNSAILEASVSTINEAKLNTVYLTRPGRNEDPIQAKVRFKQDLPLRILPSQVSVSMFGCPFVSFAQMLFLDFETNTTIDNQYNVTGIKHDITPGKFTTSLTLAYGDAYGKFENIASTIDRTLKEIQEKKISAIEEDRSKSKDLKPQIESFTSSRLSKDLVLSQKDATLDIITNTTFENVNEVVFDNGLYKIKIIFSKNIKHVLYDKDDFYFKILKDKLKINLDTNQIPEYEITFDEIYLSTIKPVAQTFYINIHSKLQNMLKDEENIKITENVEFRKYLDDLKDGALLKKSIGLAAEKELESIKGTKQIVDTLKKIQNRNLSIDDYIYLFDQSNILSLFYDVYNINYLKLKINSNQKNEISTTLSVEALTYKKIQANKELAADIINNVELLQLETNTKDNKIKYETTITQSKKRRSKKVKVAVELSIEKIELKFDEAEQQVFLPSIILTIKKTTKRPKAKANTTGPFEVKIDYYEFISAFIRHYKKIKTG